jgi:nucleotide-binding universal stress UspA family protein
MKKILVPVDFSGHTGITCTYAAELADSNESEIFLFHTYFDQIIITDTSFPDTLNMSAVFNEELLKDIQKQANESMDSLKATLNKQLSERGQAGCKVSTRVVGGEIEHELKILCNEYHPDMVIMGTTGKGNTLQVWGKVSTYIMDHAHVPVITVPAIRQFRGFDNIMFAADLGDGNELAIRTLNRLFSPAHSIIHVVHFAAKHKPGESFMKMKALEGKLKDEPNLQQINFQVIEYEEDNQRVIDLFVARNQVDLIGFQPHKRSLLSMLFTKKITRKNLFETNIPMIAVPG